MSERLTAVKVLFAANITVNADADMDIYPTKSAVADIDLTAGNFHKWLFFSKNENENRGDVKVYKMGCHIWATTLAKLDDAIESALKYDTRSFDASKYRGSTPLWIHIPTWLEFEEVFEAYLNIEVGYLI